MDPTAIPPSPTSTPHDRNYATALHHAHQIHLQKETSNLILSSTEDLLDLPTPSSADIQTLKTLLPPFQPSDYDALIHERNILSKCGYILCANPPNLQPTTAKYRLLFGKGRGPEALRVVDRRELEKWCSEECGRRALFLRVQLEEEPAWLRGGGKEGVEIKLLEEDGEEELLRGIRKLEIRGEEQEIDEQMKALAIERGDGGRFGKSSRIEDVRVKENMSAGKAEPAAPKGAGNGMGEIEGYKPKENYANGTSEQGSDTDEDGRDIMDTI